MKKLLRSLCPTSIHKFYGDVKFCIRFHFFRKGLISEMFRGLMGYDINWDNPRDINEKINWMKLYYDTSLWTKLADKYLVRDYVRDRLGDGVLTKLYGVWDNAEDIDFSKLPEQFVLKTNQGAGTVLPVTNKKELDVDKTRKQLATWLKMKFGYKTCEPHYLGIPPVITAEQYLENDSDFSNSLVDYKLFCLSGKVYCILVCTDRVIGKHTNLSFYTPQWVPISDMLAGRHAGESMSIPKPKCLQVLIEYAEILAQGHPQVRVDFYIVNNHIYFGEMTFTSQGGYMDYISREHSLQMGELININ